MVQKKEGFNSDTPFTTATLAEIFIKQGLLGKGLKIYQKLSRFEPDNPAYKNKIAELTQRIKKEGTVTDANRNLSDSSFEKGKAPGSGVLLEKEGVEKDDQVVSSDQDSVLETLKKWLIAVRKRKKHVQKNS
jgi:hypothetical protein